MPLYGFHCGKCDTDSELLVGFADKPRCPHCHSRNKMERLVSRPAPPGKSKGTIQAARARAAREGHLSNYSRKERGG
ncbi:zinc ribbon domain-containing protein [Rhodopseudomonas sp. HC1]|uniref:FmdB family zinc ribbon protein n=1 Tax=Rhodopseudomonas infernalis TaxID=2897386 RepID=UPI001EE8FC03|nr:zinc ribbon domain-containing protein [Rhodopseudomonas infernalis]MCG6204767.1 zinc ribbon domain-containing protein [Rhodopseudomonas infernalis]